MKEALVQGISDISVQDIVFSKPVKNKYGSYISNAYIKENNEKKDNNSVSIAVWLQCKNSRARYEFF